MTRVEIERMLNAVTYFAQRTTELTARKLFKLLYLLDVEMLQSSGRTITGLMYAAYTPGPSAPQLSHALESPPADLASRIKIKREERNDEKVRHVITPTSKAVFDELAFTPRQLLVLKELAVRFEKIQPTTDEITAIDNGAWRSALTRGRETKIDLMEALSAEDQYRDAKIAEATTYARRAAHLRSFA